ncbi:MAG TPA: ATP-binding protein [Thermoprotei archaeon]|nr:ATP-binding protein [Thermoprotei archaeon]
MVAKFINREKELKALENIFDSNKFEFLVVYGRRRIGKTRLILEAVKGRDYIYYLAVERGNLERFKRTASKLVGELRYVKEDWEAYFHFLKNKIIIIDEFPNLIKEDKAVLSIFQKIVDTILLDTRTKLILVGSSISMMREKVLSYKSPLYGRRTGQIRLKPLNFRYLKEFFPEASPRELVEIYGFADGIPYYLEKVRMPLWEWLDEELKDPKSFLREEGDFLLRYEFEEVGTYKRILEAIAAGKTRLGEIKSFVGRKSITEYMKNLIEIELIEHVKPIAGGKRGIYRIRDNFTRFWFRYIYPNLSEIETGLYTVKDIKRDYDSYLGEVYEKIALEHIIHEIKGGRLPMALKFGKWWHKGEEIDIVGLKGRELGIFVEVKWSDLTRRDIKGIFEELIAKSRRFDVKRKTYVIVCRSGQSIRAEDLKVYTLEDIVGLDT